MGHLSAKNEYLRLQEQLNRLPVGAPGEGTVFEILEILFSPEEADLMARMPLRLATLSTIARRVGQAPEVVKARLATMADKGLVFDLELRNRTFYIGNPTVVGFFEFSMMRIRDDFDQKKLAELFHRYIVEEPEFFGQCRDGKIITPFRTLVREEALPESYTEVLDWESATALVESSRRWARGNCHCRHVAHHQGHDCQKLPMDVCMVLGTGAVKYMRSHDFVREIEKAEAMDLLARTREAGTVFLCDNVQRKPTFLCNCCGCCCEVLLGFKKWHTPEAQAISSNFIASVEASGCNGCKRCEKACPVEAIQVEKQQRLVRGRKVAGLAVVDEEICLGCGVCVLQCREKALTMRARPQRRITPVNQVTRYLLAALEQGKLQDMLFDRKEGMGGLAANTLLGAFFKLPLAKQLLANDLLKSRFLRYFMERRSTTRAIRP